MLTSSKIEILTKHSNAIRKSIVEMLIEAKSGHLAGALGMADIFCYLYFHALKHNPKKPNWDMRDRLVLSNGHICPVLYATMAHSGYFPIDELKTLRKFGSRLQGHPHREYLDMIETSSGPLGSGLSQTVGMALAHRIDHGIGSNMRFYCLMSDGELNEGNTWEAAMLAQKEKLSSVTAIIDRNNIQIDGFTEDIMPLNSVLEKWRAWNWNVIEINGHDFVEIDRAINTASERKDKPTVIIAHTIPSKGIPQFERKFEWHGKPPLTDEEIRVALDSMRSLNGKIEHH